MSLNLMTFGCDSIFRILISLSAVIGNYSVRHDGSASSEHRHTPSFSLCIKMRFSATRSLVFRCRALCTSLTGSDSIRLEQRYVSSPESTFPNFFQKLIIPQWTTSLKFPYFGPFRYDFSQGIDLARDWSSVTRYGSLHPKPRRRQTRRLCYSKV